MTKRQQTTRTTPPKWRGTRAKKIACCARIKLVTMEKTKIPWTASTKRVDIETGEQLTEYQTKQNYIHVKTTKYATLNFNKSKGHIEHTKQYRKQPQLQLFPTNK